MSRELNLGFSRRAILGAGVAGLAVLATPAPLLAAGRIKIGTYEGYFKLVFDRHIFPGFTRATGISVDSVAAPGGEAWLAQLTSAAARSVAPVDVSLVSAVTASRGVGANLWAQLDPRKMPNAAKVGSEFITRLPNGKVAGVGAMTWDVIDDTASWVVPRVSRYLVYAHPFINYMCRPDVQATLNRELGCTPVVG